MPMAFRAAGNGRATFPPRTTAAPAAPPAALPAVLAVVLAAILPAALGAALLAAAPAAAQDLNLSGLRDFEGGGAGVEALGFLKLPASARGIGMGAASRTTDEEATLVRGNPALLALVGDYYYSISHTEVLGEFRHEDLAFTYPTLRWGNFGGSANILAATAFEGARDIDENPSRPSAYLRRGAGDFLRPPALAGPRRCGGAPGSHPQRTGRRGRQRLLRIPGNGFPPGLQPAAGVHPGQPFARDPLR
jgi:hypothetical protein